MHNIEAERFGGEDKKEEDDKEVSGCNKVHHFLRSLFHQPNHLKHKEEYAGHSFNDVKPQETIWQRQR